MNNIKYTEPQDYIPKEIREKYFGKNAKKTAKGTAKETKTTKEVESPKKGK